MTITSKYLKTFQQVTPADLPLYGGRILIELIEPPEVKTKGGIYMAQGHKDNLQAPTLGVVLALGSGYEEDGKDVPIDLAIGEVVLVPDHAIRGYSSFPGLIDYTGGGIALARESDVIVSWKTIAAFEAYSAKINGGGNEDV